MDKRGQSNYIFRINIITPTTFACCGNKTGLLRRGRFGEDTARGSPGTGATSYDILFLPPP